MKQVLAIAFAAFAFASCDNAEKTETTIENSDTTQSPAVVTDNTPATTTTKVTYSPAEGDVSYRNGKVMVWKNGAYVEADADVTLENGVVVKRNGEVVRDGKKVKLEEGESVDRSGNFWNSVGDAIEDGWDATKKGVKEAAGAVKSAVD